VLAASVDAGRPLFLLWVAVLGLAFYALTGALASGGFAVTGRASRALVRVVGWFLIVTAGLLAVLWLREVVAALLAGGVPESVQQLQWGVTAPIGVITVLGAILLCVCSGLSFRLAATPVSGVRSPGRPGIGRRQARH